MRRIQMAGLALCVAAGWNWSAAAQNQKPPEPLKDFSARVAAYVKIHKASESEVSSLRSSGSATEISSRQTLLAEAIRRHHPAEPGSIFAPEIVTEFRRLMVIAMSGPDGARIRKSLSSAEPVKLSLGVNDTYPAKAPLQSTPPTLLMGLPKLPQELEYRVVGRALVLLDVKAGIIVDFVPDLIQ